MNLPVEIQSFSKLRTCGYVYIDKTAYIPELLRNGNFKFLSRPRRFGKSLLMSMLKAFFKGERELFNGLAIDKIMPEKWEAYPVIHLDLSGEAYSDIRVLENKLNSSLRRYETEIGLPSSSSTFSERLRNIVWTLYKNTGKQVVVLIDKYDNPITSAIGDAELQEQFHTVLYGFYSSLKSLDEYIHFCLLTGVTKYGHLSVFSGLNNLMDISLMNEFAGICGITEEELHTTLFDDVMELADGESMDIDATYDMLKEWYDGYHFSKSMLDVYNPFSVMNALGRREVAEYWYQTGKPTLSQAYILHMEQSLGSR